ncbi:hypothetical protein B9G69_003875 [Bdellovibrio sp. SKB1291214]|uniref:hypothetical protein n=1 Tax=Bdellovibrio sp. SKB1291214 TaxID=1732569 RepID=UPI000B5153D3|nr:hypothetical protein [Bdellovibrio sp. SKB1291214]UYL09712.1 hypothetical protein B9G69_003875 [Bdellovibrio sp. SKB1291214]
MNSLLRSSLSFLLPMLVALPTWALPSSVDNPQGVLWNLLESGHGAEAAQFEGQLEKVLQTSPIRYIKPLGGGMTESWVAFFENNVVAVLKPAMSENPESAANERAAYVVDRALGLNMVPLTVTRKMGQQDYSLQLFYPAASSERQRLGEVQTVRAYDLKWFDGLVVNFDRDIHGNHNIVTGRDGRLVAIDNSLAFYDAEVEIKGAGLYKISSHLKGSFTHLDKKKLRKDLLAVLSKEKVDRFMNNISNVQAEIGSAKEVSEDRTVVRQSAKLPFVMPIENGNILDLQLFQKALGEYASTDPIEGLKQMVAGESRSFDIVIQDWKTYSPNTRMYLVQIMAGLASNGQTTGLSKIVAAYPEELLKSLQAVNSQLLVTVLRDLLKLEKPSAGVVDIIRREISAEILYGLRFDILRSGDTIPDSKLNSFMWQGIAEGIEKGHFDNLLNNVYSFEYVFHSIETASDGGIKKRLLAALNQYALRVKQANPQMVPKKIESLLSMLNSKGISGSAMACRSVFH